MKKSPSQDGDGRPKLKPNSFPPLKLKTAHSVSLTSFSFLKLDNMSCQMNHTLYIVLNFEVLEPCTLRKYLAEEDCLHAIKSQPANCYYLLALLLVFTGCPPGTNVACTDVLNLPGNRSSPL